MYSSTDSGNNSSSITFDPTCPDIIPPTVVSIVPANLAQNVSANTNVDITWDEDVVLTSGDYSLTGKIQLYNSSGAFVPATVSYSNTGGTFVYHIDPLSPLPIGTSTIVLSNTILDLAGNAFAGQSSTFSVSTNPYAGKLLVDTFDNTAKTITFKWLDNSMGINGYNFYARLMTAYPFTLPLAGAFRVNTSNVPTGNINYNTSTGVATYTLNVASLPGNANEYFYTKTSVTGSVESAQTPLSFKPGDITIDLPPGQVMAVFANDSSMGQEYPDYQVTYTDAWRLKYYLDNGMTSPTVYSLDGADLTQTVPGASPDNLFLYILPSAPDGVLDFFDPWILKYNMDTSGIPALPGL